MLYTVNCSAPSTANGAVIEPHNSTTEGAAIHYNCDELQDLCDSGHLGLIPHQCVQAMGCGHQILNSMFALKS